jgi:hypothetical protein
VLLYVAGFQGCHLPSAPRSPCPASPSVPPSLATHSPGRSLVSLFQTHSPGRSLPTWQPKLATWRCRTAASSCYQHACTGLFMRTQILRPEGGRIESGDADNPYGCMHASGLAAELTMIQPTQKNVGPTWHSYKASIS